MKHKILIITVLVINSLFAFSQETKIDSLKNLINTKETEKKVSIYIEISDEYFYKNKDSAIFYGNIALELTNEILIDTLKIRALNNIGSCYDYAGKSKIGLKYFKLAQNIASNLDNLMYLAETYENIAVTFSNLLESDSSLNYYENALKINEKINNKKGISNNLYNLGKLYKDLGDLETASDYMIKSLKIKEELNDIKSQSIIIQGLAELYFYSGNFEKSIEYSKKSIILADKIDLYTIKANSLAIIGKNYAMSGNIDSANFYINSAIEIATLDNNLDNISAFYDDLGNVAYLNKDYQTMEYYFFKEKEIVSKLQNNDRIVQIFTNLSRVYKFKEDYKTALKYNDSAYYYSFNNNILPHLQNVYTNYSDIYEKLGDLNNSLKYYKLYSSIKDTILNNESLDKISELEILYETEKKDAEIINNQNEIQLQKAKNDTLLFIIVAVILLILILIILFIYKNQKQKSKLTNQKLEVKEKLGEEFASYLHTDLGNRIIPIIYSLENKNKESNLNQEISNIKEFCEEIRKQSHILQMPTFTDTHIDFYINNMIYNYKNTEIQIEKNLDSKINWTKISQETQTNIYRIIQELFNNSVKHSKPTIIKLELLENKKQINLQFSDNGKGYNPSEIKQNFGYKNEILLRAESLRAKFTDKSQLEKGANLIFEIPLN